MPAHRSKTGSTRAQRRRAGGVAEEYAAKSSMMVLLAPDTVEAIVEGRTDDRVMLKMLDGKLIQ